MALSDGLQSYWDFDNDSQDGVGTIHGSDTSMSYSNTSPINGYWGSFNGSSSTISFGDNYDPGTGAFSVSLWMKTSTTGSYKVLIGKTNSGGTHIWEIRTDNTNHINASFRDTGADEVTSSASNLCNGSWHHVVVTRPASGGNVTVYVDGSSSGTVANNSRNVSNAHNLRIGKADSGSAFYYTGNIDEVGIWNKELSSAEVTELYNSGTGKFYPFSTNVTVTPQALNLSTGAATQSIYLTMPVLSMGGTLQTLVPTIQGASSGGQNNDYTAGTVRNGTGGPGTQYIYADRPTATAKIDDSKYDYSKVKDPRSY